MEGVGVSLCPHPPSPLAPYKRLYNFATLRSYIFISFQQITLELGNFQWCRRIFPELVHVKSEKENVKRSIVGEFSLHKRLPFNELQDEGQDKGTERVSKGTKTSSSPPPLLARKKGKDCLSLPRGKQIIKSATTKHFCVLT